MSDKKNLNHIVRGNASTIYYGYQTVDRRDCMEGGKIFGKHISGTGKGTKEQNHGRASEWTGLYPVR
ncbi:hypothetical protein LQZ21_03175 [Treponema sp. TIM-1]|uniref:hypothetical protein n=1 Tax=Treponema sp. TIM-1 TaxID=2898417 RepID=UPI0039800167